MRVLFSLKIQDSQGKNMEEDTSNDVITIDDKPSQLHVHRSQRERTDKPIKELFIFITKTNNNQKIVIKNAEIAWILQKEFDIIVTELHVLEVDIYTNIIKKFLKDWPEWDEIGPNIYELRNNNDSVALNRLIDEKYISLKNYLKVMLDVAKPMAKSAVKTVKESAAIKNNHKLDTGDDVVMELQCTRAQLNQLIYRHPRSDLNNTIFNIADLGPSMISLNSPTYESILNWWDVSIHIKLNCLNYIRDTVHELKHMLVNKKLNYRTEPSELNKCFQEKAVSKTTVESKKSFIDVLDKLALKFKKGSKAAGVIDILFNLIKTDLHHAPEKLKIPASYRKHCSNYSYVRYLYTDVKVDPDGENAKKYDLQIEETISPMYQFYIGKTWNNFKLTKKIVSNAIWSRDCVHIECKSCKETFHGYNMLENLQKHFYNKHQPRTLEPEWYCSYCKKVFTTAFLTSHRWYHKCGVQETDCPKNNFSS